MGESTRTPAFMSIARWPACSERAARRGSAQWAGSSATWGRSSKAKRPSRRARHRSSSSGRAPWAPTWSRRGARGRSPSSLTMSRGTSPRRGAQRMPAERGPIVFAVALGIAALVASLTAATTSDAYCRTTTCGLPPGFAPSPGECYPPNFEERCAMLSPPAKILPLYWANACVSYDIQADASRQVPYQDASRLLAAAFAQWTSTVCPGAGGGRVSIDVSDLGPVSCDLVQYSSDQGNPHVIVFHDDVWPHDDSANTLGLTTITFDKDSGEIYDADMEINSTPSVELSLGDPPPMGFDFQSIIQHETGHFLGMAHSGETGAAMLARY